MNFKHQVTAGAKPCNCKNWLYGGLAHTPPAAAGTGAGAMLDRQVSDEIDSTASYGKGSLSVCSSEVFTRYEFEDQGMFMVIYIVGASRYNN